MHNRRRQSKPILKEIAHSLAGQWKVNLQREPRKAAKEVGKQEKLMSQSKDILVEYQEMKPDCCRSWGLSAKYRSGVSECRLTGQVCPWREGEI